MINLAQHLIYIGEENPHLQEAARALAAHVASQSGSATIRWACYEHEYEHTKETHAKVLQICKLVDYWKNDADRTPGAAVIAMAAIEMILKAK